MNTSARLRRFINSLKDREVFTCADVLDFGKRSAVAVALMRLVRKGIIVRLASGVYMKGDEFDKRPTAVEVAQVKARAFGKSLSLDGNEVVRSLSASDGTDKEQTIEFTIDGYSSSFKYGKTKVVLRSKNCKKRSSKDENVPTTKRPKSQR